MIYETFHILNCENCDDHGLLNNNIIIQTEVAWPSLKLITVNSEVVLLPWNTSFSLLFFVWPNWLDVNSNLVPSLTCDRLIEKKIFAGLKSVELISQVLHSYLFSLITFFATSWYFFAYKNVVKKKRTSVVRQGPTNDRPRRPGQAKKIAGQVFHFS